VSRKTWRTSAQAFSARSTARRLRRRGAAPAPEPERRAGDDHRHAQPLAHAHVEREQAEEAVGLAEELGDEAQDAVAGEERARHLAEPARLLAVDPEDDEEEHPLEQELVDLRRVARQREFDCGKTIAQGRLGSAKRPHSSPLMKLPIRPAAKPVGTHGATRSVTSRKARLRERANSAIATITPSRPPWNAMPPFQTARISNGWAA
jgi:hypothetical protein